MTLETIGDDDEEVDEKVIFFFLFFAEFGMMKRVTGGSGVLRGLYPYEKNRRQEETVDRFFALTFMHRAVASDQLRSERGAHLSSRDAGDVNTVARGLIRRTRIGSRLLAEQEQDPPVEVVAQWRVKVSVTRWKIGEFNTNFNFEKLPWYPTI